MIRTVFYFVDDISTPFVVKDIQKISEEFEQVFLFSCELLPEKHSLPANVTVFENFVDWRRFSGPKTLIRHFIGIINIYLHESYKLKRLLPLKKSLALLSSNIFKAEEVTRYISDIGIKPDKSVLYYSFWFYDSIYLAWIKKCNSSATVVTRAHSGDLYEDHISIRDKLLFRHFQMGQLDGIYPISAMGKAYLSERYPKAAAKIKTIFLGTEDPGVLNPFDAGNFTLVSCASLRHHKRIHRIAEALYHIDFPMTWIHFGDENLHTSDPKIPDYIRYKEALGQKPNIKYIPMGQTNNETLLDFYKNQAVSLFISLSAAEGIPVSIMEAISFGIPVLSTDVGGCREIVNQNTGILIPLDTDAKAVAIKLTEFKNSEANTLLFRQGVRKFWENHFDAQKNYKYFFEEIQNKTNDQ